MAKPFCILFTNTGLFMCGVTPRSASIPSSYRSQASLSSRIFKTLFRSLLQINNIMSSLDTKSAHETTYSEQQPVDLHIRGSSSLANTANTSPFPPTVSISESLHPITDHPNRAIEAFNDAECSMTLRQGVRLYPKAITWSVLLSMTLIMEGYSTILVPNLFAMGPFKEQFGSLQPNGDYEISAPWQSAFVKGGLVGQILGLFATGTLAEYFGYRRALMAGLITMALFILIPFFATKGVVLLIGQCMLGMPWGMFQCISTVYAADVCPVALRAYLTTYVHAIYPKISPSI